DVEGQRVSAAVVEGDHLRIAIAPPLTVKSLAVAEDARRPFAPELDLDGVVPACNHILENVSLDMVSSEHEHVGETELFASVGVAVYLTVGPAQPPAGGVIILPGHVGGDVVNLHTACRRTTLRRLLAEGHAAIEGRRRVQSAFLEDRPQPFRVGEQGVLERFAGVLDAEEAAMPKIGTDDPVEEGAVDDALAHPGAGSAVGKGRIIHARDLEVDEPATADAADWRGVAIVKDRRKAGNAAFRIMLEDEIGRVQAALRSHDGR